MACWDWQVGKEAGMAFHVQNTKTWRWEWLRSVLETLRKPFWQELIIRPDL